MSHALNVQLKQIPRKIWNKRGNSSLYHSDFVQQIKMPIQNLEQLYQSPWRFGFVIFVAGKCIAAAAKNSAASRWCSAVFLQTLAINARSTIAPLSAELIDSAANHCYANTDGVTGLLVAVVIIQYQAERG